MSAACPEDGVKLGRIRDGYPALANWIARDPDGDTYIFRKFDRLAARNILHLQARLIALEHEIDEIDEQARRSGDSNSEMSSRRWETMMEQATLPNRPETMRLAKLDELNGLLKNYFEMLALQSQVARLSNPRKRAISAFREFLEGADEHGKPIPLISGNARFFLDEDDDLITLAKPIEEDYLSRFLLNNWLFKKRKTTDPFDRTAIFKKSHVVRTVATIGMVLAATLLIGAIVTLYLVPEPKAKLGLVAAFTMFFALSLAMCTNARRAEVFAATAAYAAVLVVFVSGDLGGSKTTQCLIQLEGAIWKTVECPH